MRVLIAFAALFAQHAFGTCLAYGPSVVTISGKLEQHTFPGLPNYEDTKKGDEPEKGFYVSLLSPICVSGEASSGVAYPQSNVTSVQLLLNQIGYDNLRPLLGKTVTVSGSLLAAHTGHHHAPLLLEQVSLAGSVER
jgi:hypothetical protein